MFDKKQHDKKSNPKMKADGPGYHTKTAAYNKEPFAGSNHKDFVAKSCEKIRIALGKSEADDFLMFALNGNADSDDYADIEVVSSNKMLDISNFESLATLLARTFVLKLGLNKRVEKQGKNIDQWFVDIYVKLITDFTKELIRTTVEDLYDDKEIKNKIHKALGKIEAENDLLKYLALAKNAEVQGVPEEAYEKIAEKLHGSIVDIIGRNREAELELVDLFLYQEA
jgi:hypothetical protein